jgi:hypothetical protein
MPVQTVNKGLNTRFRKVTNVTCGLSGFLSSDKGLGVDGSESVDDDFSSYGLDWVDHYSYCSWVELLE